MVLHALINHTEVQTLEVVAIEVLREEAQLIEGLQLAEALLGINLQAEQLHEVVDTEVLLQEVVPETLDTEALVVALEVPVIEVLEADLLQEVAEVLEVQVVLLVVVEAYEVHQEVQDHQVEGLLEEEAAEGETKFIKQILKNEKAIYFKHGNAMHFCECAKH